MNKELPHELQCQSNPPSHMKMKRGSTPTFPHKLYMMLESAESLCLHRIVSWLPDGRSFQIVDPDEFMNMVLPHFFKATKFRSFVRQLNLWEFERMPTMRDNHWYHKSFIRGRPEILSGIIRTKIKGKVNIARHKQPPSSPCLKKQPNSNSSFDIDSEAKLSEAKGSVCNMSDGKYIASTSIASFHMAFSDDDEFDDKMKEIFSTDERSLPLQVESERKVFLDGSCNANLNEVLSTSTSRSSITMKESRYDYDYVKEGKSKSHMVSSRNDDWDWDSLADNIEPLSMSTVNVNELGLELDSRDDFQNFLRGLIK